MTPYDAYCRLNKLLWYGRLPDTPVFTVENARIPNIHGVTLDHQFLFVKPIIIMNAKTPSVRHLIHEMIHIAEPALQHGVLFDALEHQYWLLAKKHIKGISLTKKKSKREPK